MTSEEQALAQKILWAQVGKPYIWGGKGPIGFDCSGLIVEVISALGWVKPHFDATANDLFIYSRKGGALEPKANMLCFYGLQQRAVHVGYAISSTHMIEAGGGGSSCIDEHAASRLGAAVRIRPIFYRKDFLAVHDIDSAMFKK